MARVDIYRDVLCCTLPVIQGFGWRNKRFSSPQICSIQRTLKFFNIFVCFANYFLLIDFAEIHYQFHQQQAAFSCRWHSGSQLLLRAHCHCNQHLSIFEITVTQRSDWVQLCHRKHGACNLFVNAWIFAYLCKCWYRTMCMSSVWSWNELDICSSSPQQRQPPATDQSQSISWVTIIYCDTTPPPHC